MTPSTKARIERQQAVLTQVIARGMEPFTAAELAEALSIPNDVMAGLISHLRNRGYLDYHGWVTVAYAREGKRNARDAVMAYVWTGKSDPGSLGRQHTQAWRDRQHLETLG